MVCIYYIQHISVRLDKIIYDDMCIEFFSLQFFSGTEYLREDNLPHR